MWNIWAFQHRFWNVNSNSFLRSYLASHVSKVSVKWIFLELTQFFKVRIDPLEFKGVKVEIICFVKYFKIWEIFALMNIPFKIISLSDSFYIQYIIGKPMYNFHSQPSTTGWGKSHNIVIAHRTWFHFWYDIDNSSWQKH